MDYSINKIELRGRVGGTTIRKAGDTRCARVSLITDYYYKGRDGAAVVDSTWHNLLVWEGKNVPKLEDIVSGSIFHVLGRIRTDKYTSSEGEEKYSTEIIVARGAIEEDDLTPKNYL
ncbi:MAG: single-stranded DNA-binding protein [Bacteroidales bacterium]|nr:single-stranded DNA-binding protein [Bacteroidales bacterium]